MRKFIVMAIIAGLNLIAPVFIDAGNAQQIKSVNGAKIINMDRFAPTGSTQKILFTTSVDPDCTQTPGTTVRVLSKPQHGTIDILTDTDDFAFWIAPNIREKCNDKKVKGTRINYKSDDAYTGNDKAVILVIFADGSAHQYIFNIQVW